MTLFFDRGLIIGGGVARGCIYKQKLGPHVATECDVTLKNIGCSKPVCININMNICSRNQKKKKGRRKKRHTYAGKTSI